MEWKDIVWLFAIIGTNLFTWRLSVIEIRYIRRDTDHMDKRLDHITSEIGGLKEEIALIKPRTRK
ncbi:MAG: hypothetical protein KDK41_15005 [Leptospiraceae bacterium]|nr:hypothetical protein [Leptospiraceae bacterium]MCB1201956.1 hypothetical protein [Leptospiraceae bacterium]